MSAIEIGSTAPPFRLPSGQGPEIGSEDYRGENKLIVWFTKGLSCPFCRTHMSQIARGYPQIQALGAELLEVTISKPSQARIYVEKFKIPFPYLSDPDYRVRRQWGLGFRSHPFSWYAKNYLQGMRETPPPNDFGNFMPPLGETPRLLADDDTGFFILDRGGVVRYALSGSYTVSEGVRAIPSNEEIARELERCE